MTVFLAVPEPTVMTTVTYRYTLPEPIVCTARQVKVTRVKVEVEWVVDDEETVWVPYASVTQIGFYLTSKGTADRRNHKDGRESVVYGGADRTEVQECEQDAIARFLAAVPMPSVAPTMSTLAAVNEVLNSRE